jgi:glycosyltransferase involved in cell wall biosynthesis
MGGTEHATLRIAESIQQYGFKSIAFCPVEGSETPVKDQFDQAGFETADYYKVEPSYRRPSSYLQSTYNLAREFKKRNVDLIHCCDLLASFYAGFAGRLAGLPVLSHIRCIFSDLSRRDKSFLYTVNRFAFVSFDTWRQFAFPVSDRRGTVIYDGIEVGPVDAGGARDSVCHQFGIPTDVQIIGMVARVAEAKDYETLARAAAEVVAKKKKVRFLIVGDNSGHEVYRRHYAFVKKLLAENGVDPYFVFAGHQNDVTRFLQAMDIFVLSTHSEGLPLVILEAMAMGKPVVATNVGGIPEIVDHRKTGLLHDHGAHKEFATQLLSLLQDSELSATIGAAGRQEVVTKWSRERFASDIARVYLEMLGIKV